MLVAAETNGEVVVFLVMLAIIGIIYQGWVIYMKTCRTEDYLKIKQSEDEGRERKMAQVAKAGKGVVTAVRWLWWKKK
jgi:hypothetical protein